ncbi:outer membrane beta-barrel protein [Tenacibaculum piscium]|uniref:outer membrane beta-barrel protein n=1 Tax=Tenacibaculum piscium TaxID=1458515 RepID=UPI001F213886|nr:outer membrane beta-barrel protein [Tenacibaculum piscium]
MKNKLIILILILFINKVNSQSNELSNLKHKWFFGVETGFNKIISFQDTPKSESFQIGLLTEYYFSNQWSIRGRIKYFKTGLSFSDNKYNFEGKVISIPINLQWEFKILKNLKGSLNLGLAFNQEIERKYSYPILENTDFSSFFTNLNTGIGFNYFLSERIAFYTNIEVYLWGNDRNNDDFINIIPISTDNRILNLGIKYNFK